MYSDLTTFKHRHEVVQSDGLLAAMVIANGNKTDNEVVVSIAKNEVL